MLDYGIIGNCKTCALISKRAKVEWMCFPTFSSPSIFAKILDEKNGGSFEILTKGSYKTTQKYIENTNVLETYFKSEKASFVVIDFFPRYRKILPNRTKRLFRQNRMIRIIKRIKGKPIIKIKYNPKLNYAKGKDYTRVYKGNLVTDNKKERLSLISNVDYDIITNELYFKLDYTKYFVVGTLDNPKHFNVTHCLRLMNATKQYWKKWVSTLVLPKKNREQIIRSALVLKLLTFSETGAIVAAPTTSIPEQVGTERTWDYRFCWIRDASMTVDALKKIGRDYEARKLVKFIFDNTIRKKQKVQILYGIHGETKLSEKKLEHLSGFKGSKPVRIGNAAYSQKQNDIYGSIIDVLYLYYVYYGYDRRMPEKYWGFVKHLVNWIKAHWHEKDDGIWEFRNKKKHFTYSKLMCCVGVDRAVRIAQFYGKTKYAEQWAFLRDKIKNDILKNAWNKKTESFSMYYGTDAVDASLLVMFYHEFLDDSDPRMLGTLKKVKEDLSEGPLIHRYLIKDDFGKSKNAFTICSFWLVYALYKANKIKKANSMFKKLVKYSNNLGLMSEDVNIKTKKLVGNFPQAYTHIAMINTSILLSEWSVKRKKLDLERLTKKKRRFA